MAQNIWSWNGGVIRSEFALPVRRMEIAIEDVPALGRGGVFFDQLSMPSGFAERGRRGSGNAPGLYAICRKS